jgi:hypothetical protein
MASTFRAEGPSHSRRRPIRLDPFPSAAALFSAVISSSIPESRGLEGSVRAERLTLEAWLRRGRAEASSTVRSISRTYDEPVARLTGREGRPRPRSR